DFVPLSVEVAIVAKFERDLILQSEPRDLLPRIGELSLRERNPVRADTVVLCRVTDKRPPPAADVEEALTRSESELTTDHLQLVALSLFERVVPVREIRTGIDHLG